MVMVNFSCTAGEVEEASFRPNLLEVVEQEARLMIMAAPD